MEAAARTMALEVAEILLFHCRPSGYLKPSNLAKDHKEAAEILCDVILTAVDDVHAGVRAQGCCVLKEILFFLDPAGEGGNKTLSYRRVVQLCVQLLSKEDLQAPMEDVLRVAAVIDVKAFQEELGVAKEEIRTSEAFQGLEDHASMLLTLQR